MTDNFYSITCENFKKVDLEKSSAEFITMTAIQALIVILTVKVFNTGFFALKRLKWRNVNREKDKDVYLGPSVLTIRAAQLGVLPPFLIVCLWLYYFN